MNRFAQVHRYRDRVAVTLPGSESAEYLTPEAARALSDMLREAARDVIAIPSAVNSTLQPVRLVIA